MANNQVTIQVVANVEDGEVQNLDQLIENIKNEAVGVQVDVEDGELDSAKAKEENLTDSAAFNIDVEDGDLDAAKAKEEALNGSASFSVDVEGMESIAGSEGMQSISQGIDQAKQGVQDLGKGYMDILESAGRMEGTEAFLSMNMGAEKAKNTLTDIRSVTDALPGDDVVLQNLLSQAAIKQPGLAAKDFDQMGNSAADYMAAMTNYGKTATETQQDLMNYILAGNTAEVQLSPILASHVDDLKAANTPRERALALEKALKDEHWAGIASQDTYNNKLQTFTDLLERGKINMGSMFLGPTKAIMGFIGDLDNATGGIIGMGTALATEFGPGLFSVTQGIFTMIPGIIMLTTTYGSLGGALSAGFGAISGAVTGAGSALLGLATGPVGIAIAAIIALGVAIYEVGKYFGWWNDLPGMFGAIQAGVMSLWNAFMSNEYVIQAIDLIKQGLTDAWNAIVGFGQAIMTALFGAGGQFDILSWAIQGLQTVLAAVGPVVVWYLQTMISNFRSVYSVCQSVWPYVGMAIQSAMSTASNIIATARGAFQGLIGIWNACSGAVQSMASAIQGALDAAGSAWQGFQSTVMSVVQPIIDKINELKSAASNIPGIGGLFSGGIETPTVSTGGGYGSGPTTVSQGNTIIFNMYGDIKDEKTLDETIDAINNRIQFDALANGVTTTDNGSGAI